MIDKQSIFEIHRLNNLNWSVRKIACTLRIDRETVKKYIEDPDQSRKDRAKRGSKLDPYQDLIEKWLEKDRHVKAPVVLQRLYQHGFDGKITIVRDYLLRIRGPQRQRVPFIRFESLPAEQRQVEYLCRIRLPQRPFRQVSWHYYDPPPRSQSPERCRP